MCELFGFTGRAPRDLTEELRVFFSHGAQNPNGWGLAQYDAGVLRLEVEAKSAAESDYVQQLLRQRVQSAALLAHIRKATVGDVRTENCHPFYGQDDSGRGWLLMHNGTVYSGLNDVGSRSRVSGTTDSERLFYHLLDRQNAAIRDKGAPLSPEERFQVTEELVNRLSARNKLNLILSDGELLYAHVNMRGTLHQLACPEGTLFATRPLTDGAWEHVPMTRLLAYRNGRPVFEGREHGNEYESAVTHVAGPLDYII